MKELIFVGSSYDFKKKFPDLEVPIEGYDGNHKYLAEGVKVYDDKSVEAINIYEFHGSFLFRLADNIGYVVYGHEEVQVYDRFGKLVESQLTR